MKLNSSQRSRTSSKLRKQNKFALQSELHFFGVALKGNPVFLMGSDPIKKAASIKQGDSLLCVVPNRTDQSFFFFLFLSFFFFFLPFFSSLDSPSETDFSLMNFFEPDLRESMPEETISIVSLFIE